MSYCDLCHVYDDEHTDGEPDMMTGRYYKPLLDYFYSVEVMGEKWCDYNWGELKNWEGDVVTCMCQRCFNSMDRMGKVKWKCTSSSSGT
tara:strand:+ start:434 stop:700 length:267 start_codon:yes stop_codon:yes gene_type:complete